MDLSVDAKAIEIDDSSLKIHADQIRFKTLSR